MTVRNHWSLTALAVKITLCDSKDRIYALSGPSYVATVAAGCGTSDILTRRSPSAPFVVQRIIAHGVAENDEFLLKVRWHGFSSVEDVVP